MNKNHISFLIASLFIISLMLLFCFPKTNNNTHTPHILSIPKILTALNDTYEYQLELSDLEEDKMNVTTKLPKWLTFDKTKNLISGKPSLEDLGNHKISININDGTANATQAFLLTVEDVNSNKQNALVIKTTATEGNPFSYLNPVTNKYSTVIYDDATILGDIVLASKDGIVRFINSDEEAQQGQIFIENEDGSRTIYANLQNNGMLVNIGDNIIAGQSLGYTNNVDNSFIIHNNDGAHPMP